MSASDILLSAAGNAGSMYDINSWSTDNIIYNSLLGNTLPQFVNTNSITQTLTPNGKNLIVFNYNANSGNTIVNCYSLTTPFELPTTSTTPASSYTLSAYSTSNLYINASFIIGTYLYVVDNAGICNYSLTYDASGKVSIGSKYSSASPVSGAKYITGKSDGSRLYVNNGSAINVYSMSSHNLSTISLVATLSPNVNSSVCKGLTLWGSVLYFCSASGDIYLIVLNGDAIDHIMGQRYVSIGDYGNYAQIAVVDQAASSSNVLIYITGSYNFSNGQNFIIKYRDSDQTIIPLFSDVNTQSMDVQSIASYNTSYGWWEAAQGFALSGDGTKVAFLISVYKGAGPSYNTEFGYFDLSPAYTITDNSTVSSYIYGSMLTNTTENLQRLLFSADGTKLFAYSQWDATSTKGVIAEFTLSTPWIVTSSTFQRYYYFTDLSSNYYLWDVWFNSTGTYLFALRGDSTVQKWSLSTPWSFSGGATKVATSPVLSGIPTWVSQNMGVSLPDGKTRVYMMGNAYYKLYMSTADDVSTITVTTRTITGNATKYLIGITPTKRIYSAVGYALNTQIAVSNL
jgi:hypothetical protein